MAQKIKLRRGNKQDVPLLDQGEPVVTLDTKEFLFGTPSGNSNLLDQNHFFTPINYADKASAEPRFVQISGGGTLVYDPAAPSAIGTGAFRITGTGVWHMDTLYAAGPLSGMGGHAAIMHTSGSAVVLMGVQYYADDKTTTLGTVAQNNFIANSVGSTGSYVLYKNIVNNEGGGVTEFPVGGRWVTPRIEVVSNTGSLLIDSFQIFPLNFALVSLYK